MFKKLFKSEKVKSFIEREPRIKLSNNHQVEAYLVNQSGSKKIQVLNLSNGGVSFEFSNEPVFELNKTYEIELKIWIDSNIQKNLIFQTTIQVMHISENGIGCKFLQIQPEIRETLNNFFQAELLGANLKKIDNSILKSEPGITINWYRDMKDNELYIELKDSQILNFHITFNANYMEWSEGKTLKVGQVITDKRSHAVKGSSLIEFQTAEKFITIKQAMSLVLNTNFLEKDILQNILNILSSSL